MFSKFEVCSQFDSLRVVRYVKDFFKHSIIEENENKTLFSVRMNFLPTFFSIDDNQVINACWYEKQKKKKKAHLEQFQTSKLSNKNNSLISNISNNK